MARHSRTEGNANKTMESDAAVSDPSLACNRIFVANLQNCTESELRTYFQESYGPILSVHHVPNKFAFVMFVHEKDAFNALVSCQKYKVSRPVERKRKWKEEEIKDDECSFLNVTSGGTMEQQLMVLQCNISHVTRMREYIQPSCRILGSITRKNHELLFLMMIMASPSSTTISHADASLLFDKPHVKRALNHVYVVTNQPISESETTTKAHDLISNLCNKNARVRVQTFPACLQRNLTASLLGKCEKNIILTPTDYTHVLSLIKINENVCFMGLAVKFMCIANKDCKISEKETVPRAYYKLQEAFERFGATDCSSSLLRNKVALDCGAAPGGWTQYLIEQGCKKVYSIDPGNLAPNVLRITGVEHYKMKLQDAICKLPRNSIDIFVSDMCLHEMNAQVDMMLEAKPLLKPNTFFVVTLKCVAGHSASSCDSQVQKEVSRLAQVAYGVKTVHLFVNRSRERTVMGYLR